MSDVYKLIHPIKYFHDYVSQNIRPDGRLFQEARDFKINVDCISTANASSVVRLGNTNVMCGIKLELAAPKAEEPDKGFLVTNVELPALCSSKFRPGPPSDSAQIVSNLVHDIILNSKCINLKDLCIVPNHLVWVMYCDMVCLDNDGSLVDAFIIALVTSLRLLKLPTVEYDQETENITVDENSKNLLPMLGTPTTCSFAVYSSHIILADPTVYEEDICGGLGTNLVVSWNQNRICGFQKFGGNEILSHEIHEKILELSKKRKKLVEKLINAAIQVST